MFLQISEKGNVAGRLFETKDHSLTVMASLKEYNGSNTQICAEIIPTQDIETKEWPLALSKKRTSETNFTIINSRNWPEVENQNL